MISLVAYGFLLGWSVAWPPGPINAEMARRGLARGFRPALAVGLGACSGDALWAMAVVLGAGLIVGDGARAALAWISTALLLLLALVFFRSAWRGWRALKRGEIPAEAAPTVRGGYLLGLGMALSSPWNMAFWLAVIGRAESQFHSVDDAFLIAGAVVLGAASWCLVICTAVARLRVTFGGPAAQLVAGALTGFLMLGFAARGFWALAAS